MTSAKEVWQSLYSNELERIMKSEQGLMRKPAMLHYVLTQELKKLQENLNDEMMQFEHKILSKEENKSKRRRVSVTPLSDDELDKSPPLTQRFNFIPTSDNESRLYNLLSPNIDILETKSKDVVKKETTNTSKNDVDDMYQGYDIFPIARPSSPVFVYKTKPVPRKDDCMQLPGWSCEDCRRFYKNSNLPPEELRRKMNDCAIKHSYKYEPHNEALEGSWDDDLTILTQKDI